MKTILFYLPIGCLSGGVFLAGCTGQPRKETTPVEPDRALMVVTTDSVRSLDTVFPADSTEARADTCPEYPPKEYASALEKYRDLRQQLEVALKEGNHACIGYVRAYGMDGNGDVIVWLETESDSIVRDFRRYVFNSPYLKIEKGADFKIEDH